MISQYLGFDSDYIIIGLLAAMVILCILFIVNIIQMNNLKKNYKIFMTGKTAENLEEILTKRLEQVDDLRAANAEIEKSIEVLSKNMEFAYQKIGLIKYDAFNEMGGKLSFSLALLNENEDGIILNAVHSREGCYTYMKDIVAGNAVVNLSEEEKAALVRAKENN